MYAYMHTITIDGKESMNLKEWDKEPTNTN